MPRGFIEVEWEDGMLYRYPEDLKHFDDDYPFVEGEWFAPFPNERGNSWAFGRLESMGQDDTHSNVGWENPTAIIRFKSWIEKE